MFDLFTFLTISITFVIAGGVKGVIGLGLPSISLGILTAAIDLPTAMALMIAPSFVTNIYQATTGGNTRLILLRIWPFLLMATFTVWIGTAALTRVDLDLLTLLLGFLLITYGGLNLSGFCPTISSSKEFWIGLVFGATNGILTGMTGSFAVPGVMYLKGIGLPRDMLVQAMGLLFFASTAALALALGTHALLSGQVVIASLFAVLPAQIGMWIGQNLRQRLSERQFSQLFLIGIIVLGIYILVSTMF